MNNMEGARMGPSPLERAREQRRNLEEAYGVEGKRPLSLEAARKIYDQQMEYAREHELRKRREAVKRAYEERVAGFLVGTERSVIAGSARDVIKRIDSGEYDERGALKQEADLLARYSGYDFSDAMSKVGRVVRAMRIEGPMPEAGTEFSDEELEHMRAVVVRMTRHAVERNPLYKNGVFATEELAPLLGFTETEVRIDDRQRQLDLFKSKS